MMNDEFLADLIPNLAGRAPEQILDIAAAAVSMAAYKTNRSPRLILDGMWKRMDDGAYERSMKPIIEAVVHPTV